ncbi:MAG: hypothetical protein A2V75_10585 [Actinobacteria bacterium RBG_16_70_17]|nr:MAG: hypothetical protein A2V75_10585 [Actinobacteria bacterium RBG_16_70_17]
MGFIVAVKRYQRLPWLSAPMAYAAVFWLFHFGLVFPASLAPAVLDRYPAWMVEWLYYPETGKAAVLAAQFLGAFFVGWVLVSPTLAKARSITGSPLEAAPELVATGWLAIAGGGLLAATAVVRYGISVFGRSYEEFFPIHSPFSLALFVIAFGLVLHLAGGRSMRATALTGAWAYAPLALITFLAGARTAPLVTGTVLAVALGYRGYRASRIRLLVVLILILSAIAVVQQTRGLGIQRIRDWPVSQATADPLSGIMELGGSLRPVSTTINYIDIGHGPFLHGSTYVYPVIRAAQRVLLLERDTSENDPRLIASYMAQLYGSAMGYSVVAEAYANGGAVGVVSFGLLWGLALGLLAAGAHKPYGLAVLTAVLMPMILGIRNSFIFVPGWIVVGMALLIVGRLLLRPALMNGGRNPGPQAPAS